MVRSITIEDLYQFKFVSRPHISPDGQHVACVVTRVDERKQEYRSAIWVAPVDGGEARRFTAESAHVGDPGWSPDGRWLAFVSDREGTEIAGKDEKERKKSGKGKPQIWLMPTDGGEARQLTFMQHGASHPVWSPDGKQLLFNAQVGPADEENDEGKAFPKVRVIDRLWYRLDGVGYIYERRSHLFLLNIASDGSTNSPQQLTDGDWDDGHPAWSPDGTRIVFTSDRNEDRWRLPGADIYTLTIQDGKAGNLHRVTDGSLGLSSPSWSPDGRTIACIGSTKMHSAGQYLLYTISAEAESAAPTCLSQAFEGTCMDWTNSDVGDDHMMPPPAWSSNGETLYVMASRRGATRLYVFSSKDANTEPPTLTPGDVHVRDLSFDAGCTRFALLVADATRPQEIFVRSTEASGELRRITSFNDAFLNELSLSSLEYMPFEGEGGWPIDGWILKPQHFDPTKKYPLVVEIHGGPNTQYGHGFFHEMQMLAGEGYVVFFTNPRGSCGYGYDFADAVRNAWGEKDSLDIMKGVDALVQRGYIDEQRMGVTGGSYGGFMTNWLIGHTNRFKVAITDRCVSNMASMFGASDIGWDLADDVLGTTPWESLDSYMQMSPIKYVQNIHTPLLIIHSEQDLRCGIEQAEQLFAALKFMGREAKFIRFEGQSHGLSRGGHPRSRLERLRHIKSWFEQYLKP